MEQTSHIMDSKQHETEMNRLGRLLAHLKEETKAGAKLVLPALISSEKAALRNLRKIHDRLLGGAEFKRVIDTVPVNCCLTTKSYLASNDDFFVAHLVNAASARENNKGCQRIWSHLNECYACFDIYTAVLRGYFIRKRDITQKE